MLLPTPAARLILAIGTMPSLSYGGRNLPSGSTSDTMANVMEPPSGGVIRKFQGLPFFSAPFPRLPPASTKLHAGSPNGTGEDNLHLAHPRISPAEDCIDLACFCQILPARSAIQAKRRQQRSLWLHENHAS